MADGIDRVNSRIAECGTMNVTAKRSNRVVGIGVYLIGVAITVVGALGLAGAIELSTPFAAVSFAVGLALVVLVHERLDGPI